MPMFLHRTNTLKAGSRASVGPVIHFLPRTRHSIDRKIDQGSRRHSNNPPFQSVIAVNVLCPQGVIADFNHAHRVLPSRGGQPPVAPCNPMGPRSSRAPNGPPQPMTGKHIYSVHRKPQSESTEVQWV